MPRIHTEQTDYGEYSEWELVPSVARTTNGDSGPIEGFGRHQRLRVQVAVSAASGTTPTLDVFVEDTLDGTNWNTLHTFATVTAAGQAIANIGPPFTRRIRIRWNIGGTVPSFTFAVHAAVST